MTTNNRLPTISVIIPAYNAISTLENCLKGVASSKYPNFEIIVVDDGSTDDSKQIAGEYADVVLESKTGEPRGPAHARNKGAKIAQGDLLFFVDADVIIQPDTLSEIARTFSRHKEFVATFGSYDENPSEGEFLSQYKNLFHHFVHQQAHQEGGTFWSGCGAIYRRVFLELGGFDEKRYPRPSIEDIELGYRLRAAGYKIFVNKNIQVKHLKRWTLRGLLKTDILDRAIPWTLLIFRDRNLPNDLNINTSQRLSAILLVIFILYMMINAVIHQAWVLPVFVGLGIILLCSWEWFKGPMALKMDWRIETFSYLLIISAGVLALFQEISQFLLPLILIGLIILTARFLPRSYNFLYTTLYYLLLSSLILGFGLLFVAYPAWIMAPLVVILLLIVLINYRLYVFFIEKRSLSFALASLPLHLLYYLYSLCAFVIAGGIHFRTLAVKNSTL